MCSGYSLVSSKLVKILGFKGYLLLPLGQNENWDSPYSHMNAQNWGEGVRQRIGIYPNTTCYNKSFLNVIIDTNCHTTPKTNVLMEHEHLFKKWNIEINKYKLNKWEADIYLKS